MMTTRIWLAIGCAALGALACSGSADGPGALFASDWQDDGGDSIRQVFARASQKPLSAGTPLAVGVTASGLVATHLDKDARWRHDGVVDSRPTITGDVVVATGGGKLFALNADSGSLLWSVSADGRSLRGAGDDGVLTVASLGATNGGQSMLVAVDRQGSVVRRIESKEELGSPAVMGGLAFVPWGNQYVSALDVDSGAEAGRLLVRQQVSLARNIGGSLFFGERGLVRFDEKIGEVSRGGGSTVALPKRALPGTPVWHDDGSRVHAPSAGARDKISLYARPSDGATVGVASDRFASTYFRIAMGFESGKGELRWVRSFEHDVLGGAAAKGGFAFCLQSGEVHLVGAKNGADAGMVKLGEKAQSCVVQAGALELPAKESPETLATQAGRAVAMRQAQMVAAQEFLLGELAKLEDAEVTKQLLELSTSQTTAPKLVASARALISKRRTGAEYMLAALKKHYDFLSDSLLAPPVGPIADALGALGVKEAAPLLTQHINDPANSPDDVARAAKALESLASPDEYDELKTFFSLYRATADQDELVAAVISVAKALLRIGGKDGQLRVRRASTDPLTHPAVRAGIEALESEPADSKPKSTISG